MVKFNRKSPYFETSIGPRFIGHYVHREILPADTDYMLEVGTKYHERPGLLAFDLFGTRDLAWVFIAMNRDLMTDPIYSLRAGMTISVPTRERILELVGQ